MPDPIASSSVLPNTSDDVCRFDDDPPLTCGAPAVASAKAGAVGANTCELPPAAPAPAKPAVPSASSDLVQKFSDFTHSVLLAATLQPDPNAPPLLTVRPDQLDLQGGLPRFEAHSTVGNLHLTTKVDVFNAGAHLGSLNEDGSRGENAGIGANQLNGELTLDYKGWSLTLGVGDSIGGSIASGEGRDLDADGVPERCFKMTLGPYTLGECDEL